MEAQNETVEENIQEQEKEEVLEERYQLVMGRIRGIGGEELGDSGLRDYFDRTAQFLLMMDDTREFLAGGGLMNAPLEELRERNHALYADILPGQYEQSYGNPSYAVERLSEYGQLLSCLYSQLRRLIGAVYEKRTEEIVVRMELFMEVYTAFACEWKESRALPPEKDIRKTVYWFLSDYAELFDEQLVKGMVCAEDCFAADIIRDSDLSSTRYLYAYGEYVSDNELRTAEYMASLPAEKIALMADTYTEGYRLGFEAAGIDLSKKATAGIHYRLGFERMMRRALENLEAMGLKAAIIRGGFQGGLPNRQFTYDHKDDAGLFLDKNYLNRKLEARRAAFEKYKEQARGFAGPAVLETFGEADFKPVNKAEAVRLTDGQNREWVEFRSRLGVIKREYIIEEERSFTIIAFPVPEIGPVFEELFDETIRINTLDYRLYQKIQQTLIDALDTADYCEIKGGGDNRTDLRVNLWKLKNPEKETIFENCVADVNIPVGEVFTSPVLEGTSGLLHVTKVFLKGLEYRNLAITFEDGMIKDYTCDNFETEEESRKFVRENVMARRETLPMGEFAIGTNTTAYVVARRLGVEAKLPILIAEKTGPHFAVGDTCYSHSEEVRLYNPDGKEIVAKDNEKSRGNAYFDCHTDITIPYDELEELTAVRKDGTRVGIIRHGRFVLPGTEELNRAFDE